MPCSTYSDSDSVFRKYPYAFVFFGFLLLCCTNFWFLFSTPFFYDDHAILEKNLFVQAWKSIPLFFQGQVNSEGSMNGVYRPLLLTWFTVISKLSGHSLAAFRLSSMVLHSLNATLLFYACVEFFSIPRLGSFLVGVVFLLHPIQTTNLALIWKQSDAWIAFFCLLSIILWAKKNCPTWAFPAIFLFSLGFKESAVALPLTWAGLQISLAPKKHGWIAIGLCLLAGYFYVQGYRSFLPGSHEGDISNPYSGFQYFLTQLHVVPIYLQTLLLPFQTTIDRIIPIVLSAKTYEACMIGFLILLVASAAWLVWKKNKLGFLVLASLFWLFPTSSFHPLSLLYDETRMYLVVGFLSCAVALLLRQVLSSLPKSASIAFTAIFIFIFFACNQVLAFAWKSERSLWVHATEVDPCAARAYYEIGYIDEQDRAYDDAQANYEKAISCSSFLPQANIHLGIVLGKKGDLASAEKIFQVLTKAPPYWAAHANYHLGLARMYAGDIPGAKNYFLLTHKLSPSQNLCEKGMSILLKEDFKSCADWYKPR